MTRRAFAAAVGAALLVIGLLPGAASAAPLRLGDMDQDVEPEAAWVTVELGHPVTQSFTAGATGRLVYVALYCSADSASTYVQIGIGSNLAQEECPTTPGWAVFPFIIQPSAQSGTQYTMTIRNLDAQPVQIAASASDYAGGCFGADGACVGDPTDIAFRTYVQPPPTVTFGWSPAHLAPGTSGPATLTIEAEFPGYVVPDGVSGSDHLAQIVLDGYPSWFTPTGIACSSAIDPVACALYGGWSWDIATDGSPLSVTIEIAGTATVPNPPGGASGAASGSGCIAYAYTMYPYIDCAPGQADLAISGPAATPPATATAADAQMPPNNPLASLLPAVLCLGLGSLFVLQRGRSRVRQSRR